MVNVQAAVVTVKAGSPSSPIPPRLTLLACIAAGLHQGGRPDLAPQPAPG
jgi:hypothetical protein